MDIVTSKLSKGLKKILGDKKSRKELTRIVSENSQGIIKVDGACYQVGVLNPGNKEVELSDKEIIRDIQVIGYSNQNENNGYFTNLRDYLKRLF